MSRFNPCRKLPRPYPCRAHAYHRTTSGLCQASTCAAVMKTAYLVGGHGAKGGGWVGGEAGVGLLVRGVSATRVAADRLVG